MIGKAVKSGDGQFNRRPPHLWGLFCYGLQRSRACRVGAEEISLLHKPSAKLCKFGIADRPCLFQPTELFDFICDAETN